MMLESEFSSDDWGEISESEVQGERDEDLLPWGEAGWQIEIPEAIPDGRDSSDSPEKTSDPEDVLQQYWGYSDFRPLQREIITSVLEGYDTLGLMPTGGGKSLTFQVPGLMLPGITLVVTPLISLMKDQVDSLLRRGIKATAIHAGMGSAKIQIALENSLRGRYKFLYVSPERLMSETFRTQLLSLEVSLLVIDECHCVCQWGYDFRPSYLSIAEVRSLLPEVPMLALTATATPSVVLNIVDALGFRDGYRLYQKSFARPNLSYSVRRTDDKLGMMLHILSKVQGSAVVYIRSREETGQIASFLKQHGVSASSYHAGLTYTEREVRQARWMEGQIRVMVATNAFGMGIDKPDVRLVIHLSIPSSLEEYYQEAGRAGRDGELSYAVALVAPIDTTLLRKRLQDAFPPKEYIHKVYESVCNYLSIGEGEGYGKSFDLDLERLIYSFRLHPTRTRACIEILQVAGFWDYKTDESRSRLMILYNRSQLYAAHVGHDKLLRALLRTYTGLFSGYVFISEVVLAQATGYTSEEVYGSLTHLSMVGVLHYIPRRNIPRLVFHIRREDARHLVIPSFAYEDRMERMMERIEACVDYVQRDDVCRSRLLLAYFGEDQDVACGQCDVCLRRMPQGLKGYIVDDVRFVLQRLIEHSDSSPVDVGHLGGELVHHPDDVYRALLYLVDEEKDWILEGNYLWYRKD